MFRWPVARSGLPVVVLLCGYLFVSAETIGPGRYHGYVAVDRWGQKVFHTGPYHLFLTDSVFERLKDLRGRPLELTVTAVDQPANPGAAMIREFSRVCVNPLLPGLVLTATCKNRNPRYGEGLVLEMAVRNESDRPIELFPGQFAVVLLASSPRGRVLERPDPDGRADWYYQHTFAPAGQKAASRRQLACAEIRLKWTPSEMVRRGKGVSMTDPGESGAPHKVRITPGGTFSGSATVGRPLEPGQYQTLAYYAHGSLSDEAGPMSARVDFDVQAAATSQSRPAGRD